ncbi:MAG: 5-(carboxyamino)imidazole ribonucleotide mutase [Dehalococcoidia bacterium]
MEKSLISIIMGSDSDLPTMKYAIEIIEEFSIPYEVKVISAHRTPDLMFEYAELAKSRGIKVIIAGAGGSAHLPGMTAAKTVLPVIGVPVESKSLKGIDSLLSIVQMPKGVPVATVAIGSSGAANAGILAAQIIGLMDEKIQEKIQEKRKNIEKIIKSINLDI